jgi:hypothetical protein
VNQRIADAEQRIVAYQQALERAAPTEAATQQIMLHLATNTLRELRVYKARLQNLTVVKGGDGGQ